MMDYPIHFECKVRKDKPDADLPMYFRIWLDGKNNYLNIKRKIPTKLYDAGNKCILKQGRGWKRFQDHIDRERQFLVDLWDQLAHAGHRVTYVLLKEHYQKGLEVKSVEVTEQEQKAKSSLFEGFVREEIPKELQARKIDPNQGITKSTADIMYMELNRVVRHWPGLSFDEITSEWINNYYDWCLIEGGQVKTKDKTITRPISSGGMHNVRRFLRKYLRKAARAGIITRNPMDDAKKLVIRHKEKEYLNVGDIKRLHELYFNRELLKANRPNGKPYSSQMRKQLQITLWYMLAGCYVGLRYSDWKDFDPRTHVRGGNLVKPMVKGGEKKKVNIPIRKPMQELLAAVWKPGQAWNLEIANLQTHNQRIQTVLTLAGIEGHYTSHCMRHTFAITSLLLGIRLETISDLMGHSSLTTTQVYARVVNEIRETQMDAWNDFFKTKETIQQVHCSGCGTKIFEYPIGAIKATHLHLTCPACEQPSEHTVASLTAEAA